MGCPCCHGSDIIRDLWVRERTPALNNRLHATREQALAAPLGRVALALCRSCGFVFNHDFDDALVRYDKDYNSSRNDSPAYQAHLAETADFIAASLPRKAGHPGRVLEIGCGDGQFLRYLHEKGMDVCGYDPALPTHPPCPNGMELHGTCFAPESREERYDALVLRHVLEHIPTPGLFLRELLSAPSLESSMVAIEVPDLQWILDHHAPYDLTYEHCNYFRHESLVNLMNELGFSEYSFQRGYGGQYLISIFKRNNSSIIRQITPSEETIFSAMDTAQERLLHELFSHGPVSIWGASGKGVLLTASLPDSTLGQVKRVIDVDRKKQGLFLPGTGLEVCPPDVLTSVIEPGRVVVMNPVYTDEISRMLEAMGVKTDVTCIA